MDSLESIVSAGGQAGSAQKALPMQIAEASAAHVEQIIAEHGKLRLFIPSETQMQAHRLLSY